MEKRAKFMVWLCVLTILLAVLGYYWNQAEQEAENTAATVVLNQINQRAREYRQIWLVNKQAASIEVNGRKIEYDHNGWVMPINGNKVDCNWWLSTLYPNIGTGFFVEVSSELKQSGKFYACSYELEGKFHLNLKLTDKKLSIDVENKS
ncbi:hypothetical protein [Vibrio sp. SCSIO 43136]|uniref:hypothetical protein n=1 Tax=Vibrio sp. SCSIO 43136 TaxID=2819101 RepID=UPI002074D436|nr:hypothetical protein [Vibrio sp. SCSIO 43136]USD65018.1 hypothetical protein J4N39_13225 [Vibrio sp. SCSIO 43136]